MSLAGLRSPIAVRPVACLGLLLLASFDLTSARQQDPPIPLPVVTRTRPKDGNVFDRPSIIVKARVLQKVQVERTDMDGESLPGAEKKAPFWTYVRAVVNVIRVNERTSDDPDLKYWNLTIEQIDRGERPLPLEFAREYVLFLDPSPRLLQFWRPDRPGGDPDPPYAFAIPQGGFEVMQGKVKALAKGGPLDAYEGRSAAEVLTEMQKR